MSVKQDMIGTGNRPDARVLRRRVRTLEMMFLELREHLSREGLGHRRFLEGAGIIVEAHRLYRLVEMEKEHRDLGFLAELHLCTLGEWCLWLVNKLFAELVFHLRLDRERMLKSAVSTQARDLYLQLSEIEDLSREVTELSDGDVRRRVQPDGVRLSSLLEQLESLLRPDPAIGDLEEDKNH